MTYIVPLRDYSDREVYLLFTPPPKRKSYYAQKERKREHFNWFGMAWSKCTMLHLDFVSKVCYGINNQVRSIIKRSQMKGG